MEKQNTLVYFIGTAGAGKSSLAGAYKEYTHNRGLDSILVNLDPGAERLPYTPDVDVRDWINLKDVMQQQGLGPNGAQVAAADLLTLNSQKIQSAIDSFRTDYVLLDTPGQIELFVFRQSGKYLTQFLSPERSLVAYLVDPFLAKSPSGFVSQILLATSVQFRLNLPQTHLLTKTDMLTDEETEKLRLWAQGAEEIEAAFDQEQREEGGLYGNMNLGLLRTLEGLGQLPTLIHTSAINLEGLEDLYTHIQQVMAGGEDILSD